MVTLLANPADADILAAADAGARVRLTLRNPLDDSTRQRRAAYAGRDDAHQRRGGRLRQRLHPRAKPRRRGSPSRSKP